MPRLPSLVGPANHLQRIQPVSTPQQSAQWQAQDFTPTLLPSFTAVSQRLSAPACGSSSSTVLDKMVPPSSVSDILGTDTDTATRATTRCAYVWDV
ncbi:hypothetical protein J007_02996 [Cryptococcus neoformans]|nr:hypothetical protein C356_03031 [Cryptococcus neoformans var. grubii c45]OXB37247.1 hypothetical protein J007_02996 [Cryptococcus neoformans var. grubii]OXC61483.1 hypothetical protein C358_03078 [Cryptococcus neoformans var. grubii MW-RSA852]